MEVVISYWTLPVFLRSAEITDGIWVGRKREVKNDFKVWGPNN